MLRSRFLGKILLLLFLLPALAHPGAASASSVEVESDPFVIPSGLERAVNFWKAVFTRYDSSKLIFFDPRTYRIYEVMTEPEGVSVKRLVRLRERKIRRERGVSSSRLRVQRGVADRFEAGVRRSGRYMPHMREVFAEEGLPLELTYLPLVESSFRTDARSFVGAVGIWQFMPGTGRQFMRVTYDLDERKDPWEATRAAARLLRQNYRVLKTWPLAVTAYNHGRAGMARAVRQVGTRDIATIIERYRSRSFKFASKNFYAEFLAAVHVMREVHRHFPSIEYDEPVEIEEIPLRKYVPVAALVRHSGVTRTELLEWNPALSRRARWMPEGYRLKVHPEHEERMRTSLRRIEEMPWIPHRVRRGESLSRIASRYGTTIYDIQVVNGLKNVHFLRVGQELKIPRSNSQQTGRASRHRDRWIPHRVRRGESLSHIASRYGTSVYNIQVANGLKDVHLLRVGQELKIPRSNSRESGRTSKRKSTWKYHRVRQGESLWVIARRYRVSVAMLRRVNGISKADKIYPGDRLKVRRNAS